MYIQCLLDIIFDFDICLKMSLCIRNFSPVLKVIRCHTFPLLFYTRNCGRLFHTYVAQWKMVTVRIPWPSFKTKSHKDNLPRYARRPVSTAADTV